MDQAQAMDNMYRYQRYIYDFTRKYFLLGRDRLVREMQLQEHDRVLEIGCGTGRNLALLAKRFPHIQLYGLDASNEMLINARNKLQHLAGRVTLTQCLAEKLDYKTTFNLEQPFDSVFFSYALTMIPPWQAAVDAALANLKSGGVMYIVDFSDQRDLPAWFRSLLIWWLDKFHVHYKPELLPYLEQLQANGQGKLVVTPLFKHYSFMAAFTKA